MKPPDFRVALPELRAAAGGRAAVYPVSFASEPPEWLRLRRAPMGVYDDVLVAAPREGFLVVNDPACDGPPTRTYDPVKEAASLLEDATGVDVQSVSSVLAYVNKWGLLGCYQPPVVHPDQPVVLADEVKATREQIRRVRWLVAWLSAIQAEEWNHLPEAAALPHEQRRTAMFVGFQFSLNDELQSCRWQPWLAMPGETIPADAYVSRWPATKSAAWFIPAIHQPTPRDALLFELWRAVLDGRRLLLPCKGCSRYFFVTRSRGNRKFHNDACRWKFHQDQRTKASEPSSANTASSRRRP
jgi:hypothetical protein